MWIWGGGGGAVLATLLDMLLCGQLYCLSLSPAVLLQPQPAVLLQPL